MRHSEGNRPDRISAEGTMTPRAHDKQSRAPCYGFAEDAIRHEARPNHRFGA